MYQNVREGKIIFFDTKIFKIVPYLLSATRSSPFITDFVDAMTSLIQKRHNLGKCCITIKVSRRMQRIEMYLAKERSCLAFFRTDQGHSCGSNVGNEFGFMLRTKGPYKPESADDIVHIHFLMICRILIEYNIVCDTKAPLLRCFTSIPKLNSGNIITTGQYMNYQTFRNLKFRPMLKKFFQSTHIDLRDTSNGKNVCICRYHSS